MPKTKDLETGVMVAFGCLPEEKEELEKEAKEEGVSVSKIVRRKLFPRK